MGVMASKITGHSSVLLNDYITSPHLGEPIGGRWIPFTKSQ